MLTFGLDKKCNYNDSSCLLVRYFGFERAAVSAFEHDEDLYEADPIPESRPVVVYLRDGTELPSAPLSGGSHPGSSPVADPESPLAKKGQKKKKQGKAKGSGSNKNDQNKGNPDIGPGNNGGGATVTAT